MLSFNTCSILQVEDTTIFGDDVGNMGMLNNWQNEIITKSHIISCLQMRLPLVKIINKFQKVCLVIHRL